MYRFMSVNLKWVLFRTNINSKIGSRRSRRPKDINNHKRKYKYNKIFNTQKTLGQMILQVSSTRSPKGKYLSILKDRALQTNFMRFI